ncbi:uncharacterized protein PHACADRAFT_246560 [Phanerochaete carnosa HHB-10118-sp]|uniref:Golgi to ER traffic protein 2 n=1 Tax=Phanerochaete carnosa (strain HHB-10118-sp) TaxID=650164 RepID=K5WM83_PHACS|nr:uncharacterized protein PHACADRAFT_246560 [Phanerochaete carnosa HHB-10118-sp]EKM60550.1 hypothetical protein PHACADRAFT_246560 [Phanerochaete carnosa HHB-10118-sp]
MSSAAAKAEARRKAILNRGADRLAKLTTSARGEDSPVYSSPDPPPAPLPTHSQNVRQFLGEDTPAATPPRLSRTASDSRPTSFASTPDPTIWSEEQQQQLLNALMGAAGGASSLPGQQPQPAESLPEHNPLAALMGAFAGAAGGASSLPGQQPQSAESFPEDHPLNALMSMMSSGGGQGGAGMPPGMVPPNTNMFNQTPDRPAKKTFLQKLMPLVHLVAGWMLLAYFVLWKEPQAFEVQPHTSGSTGSAWSRWAELAWRKPEDSWGVQFVPFFWAFTTLTVVLHSWRIFKGVDPVRLPTLLSFALPHLPAPLPSLILNGMKYMQIGSVFIDDIAVLLFGVGFIIWLASCFAS